MADNPKPLRQKTTDISSAPADEYFLVTPSSAEIAGGGVRSISCSEDGFLNLTQLDGIAREDVPVFKGYNPLAASVIDDPTTGSAPGAVWGLR